MPVGHGGGIKGAGTSGSWQSSISYGRLQAVHSGPDICGSRRRGCWQLLLAPCAGKTCPTSSERP